MEQIKRGFISEGFEVYATSAKWIACDGAGVVASSGDSFAEQLGEAGLQLDGEAWEVATTGTPIDADAINSFEAQDLARAWGWL